MTATGTDTSSTSGHRRRVSPTRGGRTRGTAFDSPTAGSLSHPSRSARFKATCTPPISPEPSFAQEAGDVATAERYLDKAQRLKESFNRDFWIEDRAWFAIGLDGDKRPIDALASNMGHCLWTGIVDDDKAARVAERLLSPQLFSGWGIRTLATSMSAYNPVSYHNGSVWPHDTALCAAGSDELRVHRGVASTHRRTVGGGQCDRWTSSGAVRRSRPRRCVGPGRVPDVVCASGLGGGRATAPSSRDAPLRRLGCGRPDLGGAGAAHRAFGAVA